MPREWVIHEYNGWQGLDLIEARTPEPRPGQVRLKIEAFALNWGDMDLMLDRYSFSFPSFPARIGMEAAGVVDALGEGVTGIEIGDHVGTLPYFYDNDGTSADYACVDARYLAPTPQGLSPVEAASIWMQFMTAYFPVMELAKAGPGTSMLVTAATGTAGNAALNIGRLTGANMIGTTRDPGSVDYLIESGASHVIVTSEETDIAAEIRRLTNGQGVDAVFDPVGAGMIHRYSPALARDAQILFYGTLDGVFPTLPFVDMFQANATFKPYSLFNYVEDDAARARGVDFVTKALANGVLSPRIDRVYPMEGYREAWAYLSQPRDSHGKVVIETAKQ
jgi:NADPH:quinone reductase-like Zn-dependent oxidoreductase